jgi:two-component system chemotaxis response regulator CheY
VDRNEGELVPRPSETAPVWVLIADDEAAIAEALAEFVAELGYRVLVAANGQQALALVRQHWPALVLTDLMMPRVNGAGFIAALHTEAASRQVAPPAVILLTAVDGRAARAAGADVIVKKPFELDHLERVIRRLTRQPPE